jgi:hypothetical protein
MGVSRSGAAAALIAGGIFVAAALSTNSATPRATAAAGGSIRGRVVMPGAPASGRLTVTTDEKVCGRSVADEAIVASTDGGIQYAVVTVKGLAWMGASPAVPVVNKGCSFVPHVSVARPGAALEVTSEDETLHTTHLYGGDGRSLFNIALPLTGIVIKRPLEKRPDVFRLACDTHPWMRGFISVTADRSVVTSADGRFDIPDIPPASYDVVIWHESLVAAPQKVTVAVGQTVDLTVTVARR